MTSMSAKRRASAMEIARTLEMKLWAAKDEILDGWSAIGKLAPTTLFPEIFMAFVLFYPPAGTPHGRFGGSRGQRGVGVG